VKYIVLRRLRQSELGWFSEIRRQGRETSHQRALNFDAPEVEILFPSASLTDAIPIALERRDDGQQITRQVHALRRQGRNWRLTGDGVLGKRFGSAMPGDLVIMALDLDGAEPLGAFEVLCKDDPVALRILSHPKAARLASSGLVAVPATDAPELVCEVQALDDGLFRSYLPNAGEGVALNGCVQHTVDRRLDDFDVALFEPEETVRAPEGDPNCKRGAAEVQAAIDGHRPVDTDAGWAEVLIDLPAEFYLVGRDGGLDEDALDLVSELLQDGVVHGCISEHDLEEVVCPRLGDEPDRHLERRLRVVLDELGVEVETWPWHADLLHVGRRALTQDEEDVVQEALVFLMMLEPLGETDMEQYQRAVRAVPMLSENEEAAMHSEVEAGTAEALDAIARSRVAVEEVVRAIHLIDNGEKALRKVVLCGGDDDMNARLGEFRAQITEVRSTLRQHSQGLGDLIEGDSAHKITSVLSRCRFTPQYLDEVSGRLACSQVGDVGIRVIAALRRARSARQKIVSTNLRLVVWWASPYRPRGLELVDLVGEGTLGLIRAVDRYDGSREAKLSTYASWWIKQFITRAMADHSGLIRTPMHVSQDRRRVLDHEQAVEQSTGHRPTAEEAASALGIQPEAAQFLLGDSEIVSLDADCCRDAVQEAGRLSSDGLPEPTASAAELRETIQACVSALDPRLALVLRGRFGMGGGASQTLEELSQDLGVTRERVRQIEAKAISQLQHPSRARMLASFLGDVGLPVPPSEENDES
jgi:RNA polymerase primary sigma factor